MKHFKSICCNAVPYELTSIKEMSGVCSECMKPTMFVDKPPLPPAYEGFIGMWDAFAEFVMSTDDIVKEDK